MIEKRRQAEPDDHEFEETIKMYRVNLLNHIHSQVFNIEDAQDIYQETLLVAYLKWNSYIEKGKRLNWLFKISNYCVLMWQRKNTPIMKRRVHLESIEEFLDHYPAEEEDQGLEEIFTPSVTKDEREVLRSFYHTQKTVAEIAAEVGASKDAVKKRLERGRNHLQDDLEETKK